MFAKWRSFIVFQFSLAQCLVVRNHPVNRCLIRTKAGLSEREKYVNPVTGFLGTFLPKSSKEYESTDDPFFGIDWKMPKAEGLAIEKLARRLDSGLVQTEWFVTGRVLPELFSEDFEFEDPDVQVKGIQQYAEGVRRIFDQTTSRAEVASCSVTGPDVITVVWRLSGRVNLGPVGLPIKPYLVTTTFTVDSSSGLISRQEDEFSIPGWDILLSAVLPGQVVTALPFLAPPAPPVVRQEPPDSDNGNSGGMARPLLDQAATLMFKLNEAVEIAQADMGLSPKKSSGNTETSTNGREDLNLEPMTWAEANSFANKFSQLMASGPGYAFKQSVADLIAGDYDKSAVEYAVDEHIALSLSPQGPPVTLFSFTTCPFCRKAKRFLDEQGIVYVSMELDERADGNALRAVLGRRTKRTSMPCIYVRGQCIGGCNDGPGLLPLANSGELRTLLL